MAIQPAWNQQYAFGWETTWGTGVDAGTDLPDRGSGAALTEGGLDVIGYPDFASGLNVIDTRKATGAPYRKTIEYLQGDKDPTVTLEQEASPANLVAPLRLLFSTVTELAGAPYGKIYNVYTSLTNCDYSAKASAPKASPALCSLIRYTGTASESHRITSSIIRSITISGAEGEALKISAVYVGKNLETNVNPTLTKFEFPVTNNTAIMFHDLTFRLDGTATIKVNSFSITMTNNAVAKHQATGATSNADTVNNFILGDFTVTGNFVCPWDATNVQIEKFTNGSAGRPVDVCLEVYYKSNATTKSVTGITKTNPGVVTAGTHGYLTGDTVIFDTIAGMTEMNIGTYSVLYATDDTFSLKDVTATTAVNTTDFVEVGTTGNVTKIASGGFYLRSNIRYTGVPLEGDDEMLTNLSFEGVDDGTTQGASSPITHPVVHINVFDGVLWGFV